MQWDTLKTLPTRKCCLLGNAAESVGQHKTHQIVTVHSMRQRQTPVQTRKPLVHGGEGNNFPLSNRV